MKLFVLTSHGADASVVGQIDLYLA